MFRHGLIHVLSSFKECEAVASCIRLSAVLLFTNEIWPLLTMSTFCEYCGEVRYGREEYHVPRCLARTYWPVMQWCGAESCTYIPLVVLCQGRVGYFCLCNKCAEHYSQEQKKDPNRRRFLSFRTKTELRAHMLREGSFWMAFHDVAVRGAMSLLS